MDCEFELMQMLCGWTIYTKISLHYLLFLDTQENDFMHIDNGKLAFILNDDMKNYALSVVSLVNKKTYNQMRGKKTRTI